MFPVPWPWLGYKLSLKQVQPGDLLFFWTGKSRARINHVGLVVRLEKDQIFFIHASSSYGVMVSELDHLYWMDHFVGLIGGDFLVILTREHLQNRFELMRIPISG